jgi:hypothetical protein
LGGAQIVRPVPAPEPRQHSQVIAADDDDANRRITARTIRMFRSSRSA